MGRVEIATLRVSARLKEGKGEEEGRKIPPSPYFLLSFGVSTSKKIRAPKESACTAGLDFDPLPRLTSQKKLDVLPSGQGSP